jgi:hypothetical protein
MMSVSVERTFVWGFRSHSLAIVLIASSIVASPVASDQARAGYVVSGQSGGVAVSSNLSITSLATASVSVNPESGTAPAAYNLNSTNSLGATISAGAYNLPVFGTPEVLLSGTTGYLNTSAVSNVDGISVSGSASASTTVDNLNLKVLNTLVVPVLSIGATTLTTSSSVSGTYASMTASGTPSFTGLDISVLGVDVTALVEASPGVLVNISGLTGLQIGIDVTTYSGDGITSKGVVTDNIVVDFNNAATLGGTINGQLIIGQSEASLTTSPVPEPASVGMMGLGLLLVGAVGAYRSRCKRCGFSG